MILVTVLQIKLQPFPTSYIPFKKAQSDTYNHLRVTIKSILYKDYEILKI